MDTQNQNYNQNYPPQQQQNYPQQQQQNYPPQQQQNYPPQQQQNYPQQQQQQQPNNYPPPQQNNDMDEQDQSHIKSHAQHNKPYNTNEIECTGFFDDSLYRQGAWSGLIFWFSIMGVGRMFTSISAPDCGYDEDDEEYRTIIVGNVLTGVGLLIILLSSLIALILSCLKKQKLGIVLFILLFLGALIYIIGSWIVVAEVPYIHCIVGGNSSLIGGYGAILFGEFFYIGVLSILLGLDLWKDKILNDFKLRMILHCSFTGFSSLIIFFGYAIIGNYLYSLNESTTASIAQNYAFCAAGWFFVFISMLICLITVLMTCRLIIMYIVCSGVVLLSCVLCAIGYWTLNIAGQHAYNAYYFGFSVTILVIGVIFAMDLSLGSYFKKYVLKR